MRAGHRILLVTIGTLLLLELVLQAGALLIWALHDGESAGTDVGGPTVLCVGDSFTYGFGASDRPASYPGVLERILREQHGQAVRVVNGALAGQDSRDVLRRLSGQLGRHRPVAVCILVGTNDRWTQPRLLTASADGAPASASTWRWRWRTLRLLRWALPGSTDARASVASDPAETRRPDADLFEQGLEQLTAGRYRDAIASFRAWGARHPARAWETDRPLALAYRGTGDADYPRRLLALAKAEHEARPSAVTAARWVMALADAQQGERAAAVARELTGRYPDAGVLSCRSARQPPGFDQVGWLR